MPRLTKIYTRKGDTGITGLGGGQRVPKESARISAFGDIDELNSQIGVAISCGLCDELQNALQKIQNDLFDLGSDLCFLEEDKKKYNISEIGGEHVQNLETIIDKLTTELGPLENFILPGGSPGAAHLQLARALCRRAERRVTQLARSEAISEKVIPYINRLSDALFMMARYENRKRNIDETTWVPG